MRQGGVQVICVPWKPCSKLIPQLPTNGHIADDQLLLDLMNGLQDGCMFVNMALTGRKIAFKHPAIFLFKVRLAVLKQNPQHSIQVRICGLLQSGHKFNKLLVYLVHRIESEKIAITPTD